MKMNRGDKVYLVRYGTFNVTVVTFLSEETSEDPQHNITDTIYKTDKGRFQLGYEEYTAYADPQEIVELFERTELVRAVDRLKQARAKLRELKRLGKGLVA